MEIIHYSINSYECREQLIKNFSQIGNQVLADPKKIPKDIELTIKENNWIAKGKYDSKLKGELQRI